MTDGKLKILQMLDEGKITVEQSIELLKQFPEEEQDNRNEYDDLGENIGSAVEDALDAVSNSISGLGNLGDQIRESVNDAIKNSTSTNYAFKGSRGKGISIHFERSERKKQSINFTATGISCLNLLGKNAHVLAKGYDGDIVMARVDFVPKKRDAVVGHRTDNGLFELVYDYNAMRWLNIQCSVPRHMLKQIHAETKNSSVTIEDIEAESVVAMTTNSGIQLENIACTNIYAKTSNSTISADNVSATNVDLLTSNAQIKTDGLKAHTARLHTSNGQVKNKNIDVIDLSLKTRNASIKTELHVPNSQPSQERVLDAQTSNGRIVAYIPTGIAVDLQASTSNGSIKHELSNFISEELSKNYLKGKTNNYTNCSCRTRLSLNTSNASIKIEQQ